MVDTQKYVKIFVRLISSDIKKSWTLSFKVLKKLIFVVSFPGGGGGGGGGGGEGVVLFNYIQIFLLVKYLLTSNKLTSLLEPLINGLLGSLQNMKPEILWS